jgi:hypothetical protein
MVEEIASRVGAAATAEPAEDQTQIGNFFKEPADEDPYTTRLLRCFVNNYLPLRLFEDDDFRAICKQK